MSASADFPPGEILTIRQLSEYLMVSEKTIYRMLDKGRVPAVRVGAQWRFRKRDIDAWLDEQVRRVERDGQHAVLQEFEQSEIDIHPLIAPENVWIDVPGRARDELLRWMVDQAALDSGVDRAALFESIRGRERLCSTALLKHAAFPHPGEPREFQFSRKRVLVAVTRQPVDFHDPHGHRPRVVVIILARSLQGYLHTISRAVKLFAAEELIESLTEARSVHDLAEAIADAEERLRVPAAR